MHVTHVKLLRRSMIVIIFAVLAAVAYNSLQIMLRKARIVERANQVLSPEMLRSADSIDYSSYENGAVRFKLHAQRLLETRQGKKLLQGIEAFDLNKDGSVSNQIRSRFGAYDVERKHVEFSEDVRLDIGTDIQIRTNSLNYDLNTNLGTSDDKIQFSSRQAQGTARGVLFNQAQKTVDLNGDLDFTITRATQKPDGAAQTEHIRARSSHGFYSKIQGILRFQGNAQLDSDSGTLTGDCIEALFSPDKGRLTSLTCEGNACYRSKEVQDERVLQGDRMVFVVGEDEKALRSIDISGHGVFDSKASGVEQELRGESIHMEVGQDGTSPRLIQSQGDVQFHTKRDDGDTLATGGRLEASFADDNSQLQRVEVRERARMETRRSNNAGTEELDAEAIQMGFREIQGRSSIDELRANGAVKWSSLPVAKSGARAGESGRSLSAASLSMKYAREGDYPESGQATGGVVLTGIPMETGKQEVRRLTADSVQFRFFPGDGRLRDFEGDGHIRVFYRKPADPAKEEAPQEFQTSSAKILATFKEADGTAQSISQWGDFQFQDGARVATAGRGDYDAVRELMTLRESPRISDAMATTSGETVEFDRKQKILLVHRRVRSIVKPRDKDQGTPFVSGSGSTQTSVVTADEMQYWTDESRARYAGNVQLLAEDGQLQANTLLIYHGGDQVDAQEYVRHLLFRRAANNGLKQSGAKVQTNATRRGGESSSGPIEIRCAGLRYVKEQNSIHYSGGVKLNYEDISMVSDSLDATLDKEGKQIERATARGKISIHQEDRRVRGDTADYYLDPGKFVVEGNKAEMEVRDPQGLRKCSARRLTFFTADDRILLENR